MKEAERITIRAREAAMQWAMQTAEPGEDETLDMIVSLWTRESAVW